MFVSLALSRLWSFHGDLVHPRSRSCLPQSPSRSYETGSACDHLKPRDAYVGWANPIRAGRLKLVVNNRRFTILSEPGERSTGMSQRQTKSPWKLHNRLNATLTNI